MCNVSYNMKAPDRAKQGVIRAITKEYNRPYVYVEEGLLILSVSHSFGKEVLRDYMERSFNKNNIRVNNIGQIVRVDDNIVTVDIDYIGERTIDINHVMIVN